MDKFAAKAINELDAALYSSDVFDNKPDIEHLEYYLNRWKRALLANREELTRREDKSRDIDLARRHEVNQRQYDNDKFRD